MSSLVAFLHYFAVAFVLILTDEEVAPCYCLIDTFDLLPVAFERWSIYGQGSWSGIWGVWCSLEAAFVSLY